MIRHWVYFILHSVLIITVFTNTAYAHTTKITPTPILHCSSMENKTCCDNTTTVTNTLSANCDNDCNGNDCSSQHQPALLFSFSFQSFCSGEALMNELCHSPRYYYEPLLKPPMA